MIRENYIFDHQLHLVAIVEYFLNSLYFVWWIKFNPERKKPSKICFAPIFREWMDTQFYVTDRSALFIFFNAPKSKSPLLLSLCKFDCKGFANFNADFCMFLLLGLDLYIAVISSIVNDKWQSLSTMITLTPQCCYKGKIAREGRKYINHLTNKKCISRGVLYTAYKSPPVTMVTR